MADRERLKQKVILDLLGNPVTLWPFVGGVAALLAAVALPIDPALPAFIGLTGIAGSMGGLAMRLLYRRDVIFDRASKEIEAEEKRHQIAAIDELYASLRADGEPRTEQLLADLRALSAMAHDDESWPAITNSVKFDILTGVDKLFEASVERLKLSVALHERAGRLTIAQARVPIIEQREKLLAQVGEGIEELSRILTEIQSLGVQDVNEADFTRILGDLDRSVEAERETRKTLDREIAELKQNQRQATAAKQRT